MDTFLNIKKKYLPIISTIASFVPLKQVKEGIRLFLPNRGLVGRSTLVLGISYSEIAFGIQELSRAE